ncbi:hypothetical protein DPMN_104137 [Dreissena polymorpha]|uniref:Uncharacterized protein n=1 Tax=Dreissena polymorpha TaxID=45954 RepID=A0A9D4H772_DREPO|nr:hypothetical protein DPMN_104137 [Dreissena polymorpha]
MSQTTTLKERYVPHRHPRSIAPNGTIYASLRSFKVEIYPFVPNMVTIASLVSGSHFVSIGAKTTFIGILFPVFTWTAATRTH